MTTQPCTRQDLRAEVTATVCVTDNGDPIIEAENCEPVSYCPYLCDGCGQDFDTWEEALGHLANNTNPELQAQKEVL